MDVEQYEKASKRLNAFLDFSKIKSKNDYTQAIAQLGRKDPKWLNFLGRAKGEVRSGTQKLFDSSDTQRKIKEFAPVEKEKVVKRVTRNRQQIEIVRFSDGRIRARRKGRFVKLPKQFRTAKRKKKKNRRGKKKK